MKNEKNLSAHKLIEYAFATPQRRVSIIENALQPPTFILDTMYPDIERATASFLISGCKDQSGLSGLDDLYKDRKAHSDHHEQRLMNALDAISHVSAVKWPLSDSWEIENTPKELNEMEIGGVIIRVKPTAIIKRRQPGFRYPFVGAVKSFFGKTYPLRVRKDDERGILFATLLHWYVEETLSSTGTADPSMCFVADVFSEESHFAAKRYKQRRKQLEALAVEISDRWDAIRLRLEKKSPASLTGSL